MQKNPPTDMPRISPYIFYEDVGAAVDWLAKTFGFVERSHERHQDDTGKVLHSAMELADGVVMMGHPGPDYRSPRDHGHVDQLIYVYVDDVDAHHAHALSCNARILSPPEDQFYGDRRYAAEDLEGHQWNFAQRIRDAD